MNLRDILRVKGNHVHTISPLATLADVVRQLVEFNCGSLVVHDGDEMVGIITERDILRVCAQRTATLNEILVEECMTSEVIAGLPDDEIEAVMGILTHRRIRHLPVVDGLQLVGMISIGDLVKAHHDRLCVENEYLKHYIYS